MIVHEVPLGPDDVTFEYLGLPCSMSNFELNYFTKTWTFDLGWEDRVIRGVPISGGTNLVKGNGTPFYKLFFIDSTQTNGEIVSLPDTKMYILEE